MVMVCFLRLYLGLKGAVSRNSGKLGNYKMPVKSKRNRKITALNIKGSRVKITQQIQQMPRMSKTEEDWNGLKLGFLKTVQPNSFSKFISAICNFKYNINAQGTYLFVSNLWLCHLHVISLLTLKFHNDWGRVIGKIKQNELDCRDTASFSFLSIVYVATDGMDANSLRGRRSKGKGKGIRARDHARGLLSFLPRARPNSLFPFQRRPRRLGCKWLKLKKSWANHAIPAYLQKSPRKIVMVSATW